MNLLKFQFLVAQHFRCRTHIIIITSISFKVSGRKGARVHSYVQSMHDLFVVGGKTHAHASERESGRRRNAEIRIFLLGKKGVPVGCDSQHQHNQVVRGSLFPAKSHVHQSLCPLYPTAGIDKI